MATGNTSLRSGFRPSHMTEHSRNLDEVVGQSAGSPRVKSIERETS